jgi:hypothetical protein
VRVGGRRGCCIPCGHATALPHHPHRPLSSWRGRDNGHGSRRRARSLADAHRTSPHTTLAHQAVREEEESPDAPERLHNGTPERCTNGEYLTSHSCGEEKVVVVSCLGAE